MDEYQKVCETLVQVSRLVVRGKLVDAVRFLQRVAFANRNSDGLVWIELNNLVKALSVNGENRSWDSVARMSENAFTACDFDMQSDLLARDMPPIKLDANPIFETDIREMLEMVIKERHLYKDIIRAGLTISNKLIFCGPPGVGKTLAAKWLSNQLNLPLYTLNLAAVMSSFLGKTGSNIQRVFQFVSQQPCILLLDEFDAIAKKRGDDTDVGELKRLVTVLLQAFDNFPTSSMLIAATNHQMLLDPAVWRRFDVSIVFPMPEEKNAIEAIKSYFDIDANVAEPYFKVLAMSMAGESFSDIKRNISHIRKQSMVDKKPIEECIVAWIVERCSTLKIAVRKRFSALLIDKGYSQREVSHWTGLSRDTIRKTIKGGVL